MEAGREVEDNMSYELGQYGEAASQLVEVSRCSTYNIKIITQTEELWQEDGSDDIQEEEFGIVSEDSTRQDMDLNIFCETQSYF